MTAEPSRPSATAPPTSRLVAALAEFVADYLLPALRWLSRFRYWCWSVLAPFAADLKAWIWRAVTGSLPPPPDVSCDPANYRQLLEVSWLPDRPPLTEFEREVRGEASAITGVVRIVRQSVISTHCLSKTDDRSARAMRAQHAKGHSCVKAVFVVHEDLDPRFEIGVFRRGARYQAIVRFSNAAGSRQGDKKLDGHGMAMKLRDVPDANLLSCMLAKPVREQDFLISSYPVFFCRDASDYTAFMTMLDSPAATRLERIHKAVKFVLFFLCRPPRVALAFIGTATRRMMSPLGAEYHSMTAYQLGMDMVVRYVATPVERRGSQARQKTLGDDYLRDALVTALDPAGGGNPIAFDFSVQIREAATPDDVEDSSRVWTRSCDRRISLARIEIPRQRLDDAEQQCACEDLSFNPWNCLPQHRPLGSLNRMRLAVYAASMDIRHRLNGLRARSPNRPYAANAPASQRGGH